MADYLVPMAGEMPDIVIDHVETPVAGTLLGAKGIGEAGTIGAAAAVGNAINDALAPFGAEVLASLIRRSGFWRRSGGAQCASLIAASARSPSAPRCATPRSTSAR